MNGFPIVSRAFGAVALALALAAAPADAQVKVENPWVRGAVPGQLSTGAFLDITSVKDAALVKAESPVAATVEVHAMEMKNNLMTMREVPKIDLPAGKQVRLAPGGFHIMLMDLKQPVKNGDLWQSLDAEASRHRIDWRWVKGHSRLRL